MYGSSMTAWALARGVSSAAFCDNKKLALSLLELPLDRADECDGAEPPLADLLADARHVYPVAVAASADRRQTAARKSPRGGKKNGPDFPNVLVHRFSWE